ncbi:MAG TPA: NAD(P)/FAD-dependent oxidoreductase [Methylomirabilota bacterium]|nr:NAD(P)/FAD-dependent oxidoreductase [Methylomirabilota bacterium]
MARSAAFQRLARIIRIAGFCDRHGLETREGLDRAAALEAVDRGASRREFLAGAAKLGVVGAIGTVAGPPRRALAAPRPRRGDVAIIGAGLAGLACGDELRRQGLLATVYEASERSGGRCVSLGGAFPGPVNFPGQVVERGGEFIDTGHKTMIGYAQRFGLALEDVTKGRGDVFYHFFGQRYSEPEVVDELRAFVDAMRDDLRTVGQPTADRFTPADVVLDRTNLKEYLETRGAGSLIRAVLDVAYTIEYGLEIDRQSCLNFLFFIHADRRSKFRPFGSSDERYHVIGGNQQVPAALATGLAGQIQYGVKLQRAARTAAGRIELTFRRGSSTVSVTHDMVVFAIPFSVLREVSLDASLGLPVWKRFAIENLQYGTNAKMMLGFNGPIWRGLGSDGQSYSDLTNHQSTWETNPSRATSAHAVLTDYSGGVRGAQLNPRRVQAEASRFLGDLDKIYPGALAAATRGAGGNVLAHLEHWPSNPLTKGAYTCNQPGYFTTIADNEGKPVGNLFFAGEHTSSFYEWQGFMEGGVVSGLRAAAEVLRAL